MIFLGTLFSAIFVSNVLLVKLDGMKFFNRESSFSILITRGIKVIVVTLLTVLVEYPVTTFLLEPVGLEFLTPIFVILFSYAAHILVHKLLIWLPKVDDTEDIFVDYYVFTNSVIFTASIIAGLSSSFIQSIGLGLGFTIGHLIIMLIMFTVRPRLDLPGSPKRFKGKPAMLITMAIIAMAFMGLAGILWFLEEQY